MRFEIKSGGVVAILFGVAALSGAVFMLGLLAGYDVGRESQSSSAQVATPYPVAAPPVTDASATAPSGGAASAPLASAPADHSVTAATVPPSPANPVAPVASIPPVASAKSALVKRPRPIARSTPSAFAPRSDRTASESSPPGDAMDSSPPGSPAADDETASDSAGGGDASDTEAPVPHAAATASVRPQPHHKPFNIQIEAAMDRSGADEMMRRLHGLGYQSRLVPAQLNGQTWYKVVIGPYPTQEAAASAQSEMRAKYNRLYGGAASAAYAPPGTSD
jgi:DedD protein